MTESHHLLTIKPTKDGSTTLFSKKFDQHYHNPNGAVAESRHVFFETPGVPAALKCQDFITIFETGFGTGMNLLLVLEYLEKTGSPPAVIFNSVEAFPVSPEIAAQFDFGNNTFLNSSRQILSDIFGELQPGLNQFKVSNHLTFNLFAGFFDELFEQNAVSGKADFIFHDPFSPDANPDLWTVEVFKKLASLSKPDTVLSTYCAATSARAAMAAAGWYVARAPGALGKREMTVASLTSDKLVNFKRVSEKRLIERLERGDFRN
ncbi:MAG: tRNA (5-methylaminomethyl-2-thiouridine)(34)-methyltransferase MnmD [Balneolaceae bacterium]|nr:tRNA (5-methylaminomethyl-2-thiouridine)(34)-methyltransferase MnmD [Balneolaceae bacterium]